MILQSKLDLSTFEIIRFRIWNQTSNPSDFGVGTMYFNTNSGHEYYNREVIYGDTGHWRAVAYLDDLTTFKDEDFNKLKEKVDLLSGDVDTDAIISNMKEVSAFLAGFAEDAKLMTMLDGKLDKTGGTITIKTIEGLRIKRDNNFTAAIAYENAEKVLGYIGVDNASKPSYYDANMNQYPLLHAGNVGDYTAGDSDRLGGMSANRYLYTINVAGYDFQQNWTELNRPFIARLGNYSQHPNIPSNRLDYGNLLHVSMDGADTAWELAAGFFNNLLMFRSGTWKADGTGSINTNDWKTIAFTDSDITGNAATATKLKDKVSLWGNEFDGTQNLDNAQIRLNNARAIYWKATDKTTNIEAIVLNNSGSFLIGQGVARAGGDTIIYGNNIKFCYGTTGSSVQTAMTITDEGNVLIGNGVDDGSGAKLQVMDSVKILETNNRFYTRIKGATVQIGRNSSIYTGGYNGGIAVGEDETLVCYLAGVYSDKSQDTTQFFYAGTSPANAAFIINGIGGAVYVKGEGLTVEKNTSLLGRALIGTTIDDVNFRLNVAGAVKITRSNDVGTYLGITVSDVLTTFDGVDTIDGYMRYSFQSHGTELLHLDGKEGGTSYFRTLVGFVKKTTFYGGALIPTGQKLTIGSVTFEEDAAGRVKVDGDMYTTGTLASGGKAKEGTGTGSGSANVRDFELPADEKTTYNCDHLLKTKNVIVQVFEKAIQGNIEVWEMILTDVTIVTEDRVTVTFGRPTTKVHKVHIIGGNVS